MNVTTTRPKIVLRTMAMIELMMMTSGLSVLYCTACNKKPTCAEFLLFCWSWIL